MRHPPLSGSGNRTDDSVPGSSRRRVNAVNQLLESYGCGGVRLRLLDPLEDLPHDGPRCLIPRLHLNASARPQGLQNIRASDLVDRLRRRVGGFPAACFLGQMGVDQRLEDASHEAARHT